MRRQKRPITLDGAIHEARRLWREFEQNLCAQDHAREAIDYRHADPADVERAKRKLHHLICELPTINYRLTLAEEAIRRIESCAA